MSRPYTWTFRRCPYAIRSRMALDVAEIDIEYREIVLRDKPDEMLVDSPKGTVPVLVLEDGRVIDESIDIMHYALEVFDPESWRGQNQAEVDGIDAWIRLNDEFKPFLDRFKYFNRHLEMSRPEHLDAAAPYLRKMDAALQTTSFLIGDRPTLADNALFPFVRQFHFSDQNALTSLRVDSLLQWLDGFLESDRFARVMVKRPLWQR